MIWALDRTTPSRIKLSKLDPLCVLDEMDGPRLFTLRDDDGQLFLAYMCGEDETTERFLIVPTSDRIVSTIQENKISLRDALTQQAIMAVVDRRPDDVLSEPVLVDSSDLPSTALPRPNTFLSGGFNTEVQRLTWS